MKEISLKDNLLNKRQQEIQALTSDLNSLREDNKKQND